ncbi:cell wall elongation regulator TseB-like domain-containing protein [Alkalibacillus aidingensis]|uniref:cell wall elongation regulator TseB-like domain-containing protein n=1 Tax=Alkalibacillus aidingensis TaxID=2747607 RepID=UPI0016605B11|nr:DUF5590 domain-containing protein [Alkalibacillus aidingensis]
MAQNQSLKRRVLLISSGILAVLLIVGLVVFSYFYNTIQSELKAKQASYATIATEHSPIETIKETYVYNGDGPYTVVYGQQDHESYYVFVPQKDDLTEDDLKWINTEDGLSKDDMLTIWEEDCDDCQLMSIVPGVVNDEYIWEIIYEDANRMYFQTYFFSDGDLYDSISFRKN